MDTTHAGKNADARGYVRIEREAQARAARHDRLPLAMALATAALALGLLLPGGANGAAATIVWAQPTKADRSAFRTAVGKPVVLRLSARSSRTAKSLSIEPVGGLPTGAAISTVTAGTTARATFRWTPAANGKVTLGFVARDGSGASTPVRTYTITVGADKAPKVAYPRRYGLSNRKLGHWATVTREAVVRAAPRQSARAVGRISTLTPEHTQNVVLVLEGLDRSASETWYRVRLAMLPNNSTGWVQKRYLSDITKVSTRVVVDRSRLTLTLFRNGAPVFKAPVGIGESQWPTPRGQFYIRSRITNFGSPVYGALAFGTSARSAVLTDWPGGGFIGIHGTNQPEILPGRVSHGCIRMRNPDIIRLASLMKVGTPVTIR